MGGSFPLFSIRGIMIRVHITFPLILIWGAIQFGLLNEQGLAGALFGVVVFMLLFVIVILHELGHSFAAQFYGVPVKEIVLLPIGGVARLATIPEAPRKEFVIAIAGPLVNFLLAGLLFLVAIGAGVTIGNPFDLEAMLANMASLSLSSMFIYVFVSNLFLGIFNLIPAFPMDGGRVLRALLATQMNYVTATRVAVSIGQNLALLFGLWGFLGGGFFIILIAIFIYFGAGQEAEAVQIRHALRNLTVAQAYTREAHILAPESTLQEAVDITLSSFQADFPICQAGRFIGLLTQSRLLETLNQQGPDTAVAGVMVTDVSPVSPHEEIFAVQQRMAEAQVDALPVVEGELFLGLLTSRDINELYRFVSNQPDLAATLRREGV